MPFVHLQLFDESFRPVDVEVLYGVYSDETATFRDQMVYFVDSPSLYIKDIKATQNSKPYIPTKEDLDEWDYEIDKAINKDFELGQSIA